MTEDFAYRAKVLITQRRYQDAVRLCRRGLLTDPTLVEGRLVLGMALLAMRRFEEVRAEMLALLRSRPEDPLAHRLLGEAYLEAGDLIRADEELRAAHKLAPEDRIILERIEELIEARDGAYPGRATMARWLDPAELGTVPGHLPDFERASTSDGGIPSIFDRPTRRPGEPVPPVREEPRPAPAGERPAEPPRAAAAPSPAPAPHLDLGDFDDPTVPDGPDKVRLKFGGDLGSIVTQVLSPAEAERMRRASAVMAAEPDGAATKAPAVAAPMLALPAVGDADDEPPTETTGRPQPVHVLASLLAAHSGAPEERSAAAPPAAVPPPSDVAPGGAAPGDAARGAESYPPIGDEDDLSTETLGRPQLPAEPVRPKAAPAASAGGEGAPKAGSPGEAAPKREGAIEVKGASGRQWPTVTPGTVTPVMPALVRAAARLAAATSSKPPPPAPPPAAPPPAPSEGPKSFSGQDQIDIDTKSYAEVSGEGRAREVPRLRDARGFGRPDSDLLASQVKFAEAVSEISEVSDIDQQPLARAGATDRPAAVPGPRGSAVEALPKAPEAARLPPDDEEEPESTVTEVPQSYREGSAPRSADGGGAAAPEEKPDPETVIERPLGNAPTQFAGAAPSEQGARPTAPDAPRARDSARAMLASTAEPVAQEPARPKASSPAMSPVAAELATPRAKPSSRGMPASSVEPLDQRPKESTRGMPASSAEPLADPRARRSSRGMPAILADPREEAGPAEPERPEPAPPRSSSQPPSFLETPPQIELPGRRAAEAARSALGRTAGPTVSASPRARQPDAQSDLPPPMPPPGRITVPVVDPDRQSSEPPPRVSASMFDSEESSLEPALVTAPRDDDAMSLAPKASGRDPEERFALRPKAGSAAPWLGAAALDAKAAKSPPRAVAPPPFDPLDRPLSPDDFAPSVESSAAPPPPSSFVPGDDGSFGADPSLTPGTGDVAFLAPEDVVSGSLILKLKSNEVETGASPLDEPISPDDFSYSPERARGVLPGAVSAVLPSALDEPISPDDFSYRGPSRMDLPSQDGAPFTPPAKPVVGPAPRMSIPSDQLRQIPKLMPTPSPQPALPEDPLDEPLRPSEFGQKVSPVAPERPKTPKRVEKAAKPGKGAGAKGPPARIVARPGGPARVVASQAIPRDPRDRPTTTSRTLPYAITGAALAILIALGIWAIVRWKTHREQLHKIEQAESAEAFGDYTSLRHALLQYRELAEEAPDNREYVARVARTYAALAFEFGLDEEQREAAAVLQRLQAMGLPDPAIAHVEAAAKAYLHAADGKLEEAQALLRTVQAPDPNVVYLRGRLAVMMASYSEADGILRAGMSTYPSWVRVSCALVEAMLGMGPERSDWIQLLDGLVSGAGRRHVGVRLLRARLYAERSTVQRQAREELVAISNPVLLDQAAPSQQAWVHLLKVWLALSAAGGAGAGDEAQRELVLARERPPARDWAFRVLLAKVLRGMGKLSDAKDELVRLTAGAPRPTRSVARLLLAETYLDLNDVDNASEALAQAEETPRLHLLRGRVLMAQRKALEALQEFDTAKRQDPGLEFEVGLESGRAYLRVHDVSHALQIAQELDRNHRGEIAVQFLLGDALVEDGKHREAEAAYGRVLQTSPGNAQARIAIARLRRWRGDMEAAKSMLEELARGGSNVDAHLLLASMAGESGDIDDARSKVGAAGAASRGPSGPVKLAQAELQLHTGQLPGVEALVEEATRLGVDEAEVARVRGRLYLQTYRIAEALVALRRATELVPGDPIRLAELARAHRLTKEGNRDAGHAADDALEIDGSLADARTVKAMNALDAGQFGEAANLLREAERSLEGRPRDRNVRAFVKMAQGRLDYENGRADEAARKLEAALELDASLAEAHFFAGLAYQDLRRGRDSCEQFTRFLELAPDTPDSSYARDQKRAVCR
ncbi:MAG: tetratricopeptide repeat protein [Deltaproteobacteria bacterium]|nr:tetratricopeptide repeat protein [Deltaproteobacteria bacterium]